MFTQMYKIFFLFFQSHAVKEKKTYTQIDKATAKSLTQIVDLLERKSAQSTEIYLGVSASGS